MSVYETLEKRGLIAQCTDPALADRLARERFTIYVGFDPTSSSLHLGNLVPIVALAHFQRAGHKVIALVGGATAMVGDPSGRSDERNLLTIEQVKQNSEGVRNQLSRFLDFEGPNAAVMVDNYDWTHTMSFIDWLRDVGKHFTVNYMVAKESVKTRMQSEQGISYTEFSYMTMQAYDFVQLYDRHGCLLQGGGSDQWGNITAGIDLIRRLRQQQAYGLTFPLITTAAGAKFGKSAGNAIWLDPARSSPWDFYQYLVRQDDRDVGRFLRIYTFLPEEEIADLERQMAEHPEQRAAQKALAYEVTAIVHGAEIAREQREQAETLYSRSKDISGTSSIVKGQVTASQLEAGMDILDVMLLVQMVKSKGEARRLLEGGGVYVNESRAAAGMKITLEHVTPESRIVLRSGKKNYFPVHVSR